MVVKLVVFDVDGTLTSHASIWWRLHEHFNTEEEGRVFYDQYFSGEISYNEWADLDAGLWKGQSLDEVMKVVDATELVPGAIETVANLKEHGIHVAILSGGLDIMAENVARRLGIEFALTNRLIHKNGVLTGEVEVCVGWGEKVQELKHICNHFQVPLQRRWSLNGLTKNLFLKFPRREEPIPSQGYSCAPRPNGAPLPTCPGKHDLPVQRIGN